MIYGGIDIGTTGSKITIFNNNNELFKIYKKYSLDRRHGIDEIDPNIILETVLELIKESYFKNADIEGIGITSFGETFVLLDEEENILMNSMLYTDKRGLEELKDIKELIGEDKIREITGLTLSEMYSLPKILYVKKHSPDIFSKVKHICLIEDYIVFSLTGYKYIDYSLATRTMMFDYKVKKWSTEILSTFGIDEKLLSLPVKIGNNAGFIRDEVKKRIGISKNIKIINVSHDQISSALGAGLFNRGEAIDGCGTCECLTPLFDNNADLNGISKNNFCLVPFDDTNHFVCYSLLYTGGALIEWFIKTYCKDINTSEIFKYLNKDFDYNKTDILVFPHFSGMITPVKDTDARGAIFNLTLDSKREDIYKAILESLCFEMKINIQRLKKHRVAIERIIATGGGSKNECWMQLKADILGIPISTLTNHDAGTVGAAFIVGTTLGVFKDYKEGFNKLSKINKTYVPRKEFCDYYDIKFKKYSKIYNSIKGIF